MQFSKMLVVDLEATCWADDERPSGWSANTHQEIIEIGAVIVDLRSLEICSDDAKEATASFLVKPWGEISNFCTELTTLTPEDFEVEKYPGGYSNYAKPRDLPPPLEDALDDLRFWCKQWKFDIRSMPWSSWGDYDRVQFQRECERKHIEYPFGRAHVNIKALYSMLTGQGKGFGMAKALDQLGLPLDGTHHRGVDDARNNAKILIHLLRKART